MSKFINQIIKEAFNTEKQEMNELFGFSKAEKEQKQLAGKLQQAKQEVARFNPANMWRQVVGNDRGNQELYRLVGAAIIRAKSDMPTVAELLPQLFELTPGSSNAVSCGYNYKGQELDGVLPVKFSFLKNGDELIPENWSKYMNHYLDNLLQK